MMAGFWTCKTSSAKFLGLRVYLIDNEWDRKCVLLTTCRFNPSFEWETMVFVDHSWHGSRKFRRTFNWILARFLALQVMMVLTSRVCFLIHLDCNGNNILHIWPVLRLRLPVALTVSWEDKGSLSPNCVVHRHQQEVRYFWITIHPVFEHYVRALDKWPAILNMVWSDTGASIETPNSFTVVSSC